MRSTPFVTLVTVLAAGAFVCAGCRKATTPREASGSTTATPAPDNSAINSRDRAAGAVTPTDQGESEADRKITAEIRKAVIADSTLSLNAHNCKIVTRSGAVTLRGPVASQAEKDAIERIAKGTIGVTGVSNELEVKPH